MAIKNNQKISTVKVPVKPKDSYKNAFADPIDPVKEKLETIENKIDIIDTNVDTVVTNTTSAAAGQ